MTRRAWFVSLSFILAAGCMPQQTLPVPPNNPLSQVVPTPPMKLPSSPAAEKAEHRLNEVKEKVLSANPDLGIKPNVVAIGSPDLEIFHRDTTMIYVTDGLVNRCTDETQLTAVLCAELGKMVSQNAAITALKARRPEREPSPYTQRSGDVGVRLEASDPTRVAELGRIDEARRAAMSAPPPTPPDPQILARTYLTKAGGKAEDLAAVASLLREADRNTTLEQQMKGGPPRGFVPQ